MRTKAEAESRLARCALTAPVTVTDEPGSRRSYAYSLARGQCIVEIDATPSDRQLQDLAKNLPILERDRAAALAIFREP